MKKISRYFILLVILIPILVLSGCSNQESKSEEKVNQATSSEKTSSPDRKELVMAIGSEPDDGFDTTQGWGRYGSPLFQSTLLKRNKDLEIENDLATEYSVSEDGLVWTVKIREDAKFSDGEALTAEDVVYTFETTKESASTVDLTVLEKVEAIDEYTVKFTLEEPQITFVTELIAIGIVPEHAHGENYAESPLGSGPFKFVQWDKGQQLILETNDQYYGNKPYFEQLTILFLDQDAAFAAAKAGEIDITAIPTTFAKQTVDGMVMETLPSVDNRGITFPFVEAGDETEEGYPIGNDVTANREIRKAIDMAIDRQALIDGVLEGHGTKASSVADGMPWWNPETAVKNDGDIEGAKKLLEENGWVDSDGDGVLEKDGLKAEFDLVYLAGDKTRQSIAMAASDAVKEIGINMIPQGKSWDETEKVMHATPVLLGWGGYDPLEMYNIYSSETRGVDYFNNNYYSNEKVDEYMAKALVANTEEEANEYWKKAQWDGETGFSALGDIPWSWLVNIDHLYLVREELDIGEHMIQPHAHGWPLTYNIEDWKWKE